MIEEEVGGQRSEVGDVTAGATGSASANQIDAEFEQHGDASGDPRADVLRILDAAANRGARDCALLRMPRGFC